MLWGGTAFNFGKDVPRLRDLHRRHRPHGRPTRALPVDVLISNHARATTDAGEGEAARERGAQGPNPFVIGPAAVERSLQVMGTCGRAQRDRFLTM